MTSYLQKIFGLGTGSGDSVKAPITPPASSAVPKKTLVIANKYIKEYLAALPLAQQRSDALTKLGKDILSQGENWGIVDWRQFGLLHAETIIKKSTLEGGNFRTSLNAAMEFLAHCTKGGEIFFDLKFPLENLEYLQWTLEDMSAFDMRYPLNEKKEIDNQELEWNASNYLNKIKEQLDKNAFAYLPLGYRHGVANEGHALAARLEVHKDKISINFFNVGNGSDSHAVLGYKASYQEISYVSFPIYFDKEKFFGPLGHEVFCLLIRYMSDPPNPNLRAYCGQDIYDIFLTFGDLQPSLGQNPDIYRAEKQLAGDCPEKAVRHVIHDFLINRIPHVEIKKVFLNYKLYSLIRGYHTYNKGGAPHYALHLLSTGAKEVGRKLLELKDDLSIEEISAAAAVVHEVNKLQEKARYALFNFPRPKITSLTLRKFPILHSLKKVAPPKNASISSLESHLWEEPIFDIDNFEPTLRSWVKTMIPLNNKESFLFLKAITKTLPVPLYGDDLWNTLPKSQIAEILCHLEKLVYLGMRGKAFQPQNGSIKGDFTDQFLSVTTLYAICDKLARSVPTTKLKGYATPLFTPGVEFEPYGFTSLPLKEENDRYSQVIKYFTSCSTANQKRFIFPIAPILPVAEFVHEDLVKTSSDPQIVQGRNHISFLQQFTQSAFGDKASNLDRLLMYSALWQNKQGIFKSSEVHSLYYFSYLTFLLFYGSKNIPEALTFQEVQSGGQLAFALPIDRGLIPSNGKEVSAFAENGLHTPSFIPFHSKKIKSLTTNQALCRRLTEKELDAYMISDPIYRDLLRITRRDNFTFILALNWASNNTHLPLLQHLGIQKTLDECFFKPGYISERLKQQGEPLKQKFRRFIQQGLIYYSRDKAQVATTLFLLRCGIYFEQYAEGNCEVYEENLVKLLEFSDLPNAIKEDIYLLQLFLGKGENLLTLIFDFQYMPLDENYSSQLRKNSSSFIKKVAFENAHKLQQENFRNEVCNAIMKKFSNKELPYKWKLENSTQCSANEYILDFQKGEVRHKKYGILVQRPEFSSIDRRIKDEYEKCFFYWKGEEGKSNSFCSFDETFSFDASPDFVQNNKKIITLSGKSEEYEFYNFEPKEIDPLGLKFLNDRCFNHKLVCYKRETDVVVYRLDSDTPYFRMKLGESDITIIRIDDKGNDLPYEMTFLHDLPKNDYLYRYTLAHAPADEVLCFVNVKTNQVEELNFLRIGLEFKRTTINGPLLNGRNVLLCQQENLKGYFLVEDDEDKELLKEINGHQGTFILRNASGKFLVVIPKSHLSLDGVDFNTEVKTEENNNQGYYIFEKGASELKNDDPAANLYLALLYKMQGDYSKAYLYLKKVKTTLVYNDQIFLNLEQFKNITDHSPDSVAFNIKLFLMILENKNLLLENQFKENSRYEWDHSHQDYFLWGARNYEYYLKTISSISPEVAMTDPEEKFLLFSLKEAYPELTKKYEKFYWPKIIDIRYQIFFEEGREAKITIPKKEVSSRPAFYASLPSPSRVAKCFNSINHLIEAQSNINQQIDHPIQLDKQAVLTRFVEFYEVARKTSSEENFVPFDFTLLALLKNSFCEYVNLSHILFYVRHFSKMFKDLPLERTPDLRGRMEEIIVQVHNLEHTSPAAYALKKAFFDGKDSFTSPKNEISLSIPNKTTPPKPISDALDQEVEQDILGQINRLVNEPRIKTLDKEAIINELTFLLSRDYITPEIVMREVILKNDSSFLKKHRPMLSDREIGQVCRLVKIFYYKEVVKISKCEPNYDYLKYPEISFFKMREGKLPRPGQLELYQWVCDSIDKKEHCHFQMSAGAGKTSYLTPLMILRAKRSGLMPVVFSTQAMYPIDKENLSNTLNLLGEELAYLEVGMHMKLSVEQLRKIAFSLVHSKRMGKALIINPQIFYALKLMYLFAAIKEEDEKRVEYLGQILYFFENECFLILDESHRNLDALTRAIFGVGEIFKLPNHEKDHLILLMDPYLKGEQDPKNLANKYAEYFGVGPEFAKYWVNKNVPKPQALIELSETNKPKAHLISLTKHFLTTLLPQIKRTRTEIDHCKSIFPEEDTESPCHNGVPSTAQFEDVYLTACLSIKGTHHRGLTIVQVTMLLQKMLKSHIAALKCNSSHDATLEAKQLNKWLLDSELKNKQLQLIHFSDHNQIKKLTEILGKKGEVIDYYLNNHTLEQVTSAASEQLIASPAHLISGFKASICFTATPQPKTAMPSAIQNYKNDELFEKDVIEQLGKKENAKSILVENAENFFSQMKEEHPNELETVRAMIDPRGFFADINNEDVARNWMEAAKLDGVLFFSKTRSLDVDRQEKIYLMTKDSTFLYDGKFPEGKRIGAYFDAAHAESANIMLPEETVAFFFIMEGLTKGQLIQGSMRLRGFLGKQRIIRVQPKKLVEKVKEDFKTGILPWAEANEKEEMKKREILNTFQEIAFTIQRQADEKIKFLHTNNDMAGVIKKSVQYKNGYTERSEHDLYKSFSDPEKEEPSEEVFLVYAKRYYELYHFSLPYEENHLVKEKIQRSIDQIKEKIPTISTKFSQSLSKQIEQHGHRLNQIEQHSTLLCETEQINVRPRSYDPISGREQYGNASILKPDFLKIIELTEVQKVFNGLTKNLYFENNQLHCAVLAGVPLKEKYLKPIDLILILHDKTAENKKNWKAEAISNEIMNDELSGLANCPEEKHLPHSAFLVDATDGSLVQKGTGALTFPEDLMKEILESTELKNMVIDAHLLKGQIYNPDNLLAKRIKESWGRDNFVAFWVKVTESLPNPDTADQNGCNNLLDLLKKI